MPAFDLIIDAIADHVRLERELGQRGVELSPDVLALLQTPTARALPVVPSPQPSAPVVRTGQASSAAPKAARGAELTRIATEIAACERCPLSRSRTRTVPGQGNPAPDILFVGEGPGAEEDQQGLAFVGAAGQLLTKMIAAMGLSRDDVFIAHIVKCRPPNNRAPEQAEMEACLPYLKRQIDSLRPRVIVCLGNVPAQGLLAANVGITRLRGRWTKFGGIPVMPTYHPAYLLRFPSAKRQAWDDLKSVLRHLGRPVPTSPQTR